MNVSLSSVRLICGLVLCFVLVQCQPPPPTAPTREVGPAQCVKNSTTFTTRFATKLNDDIITHVFACPPNTVDQLPCEFRTFNDGDGVEHLEIVSNIDLADTNNPDNNPCAFTQTGPNGTRNFCWTIALRYVDGFIYGQDKNYQWCCKEEDATDKLLNTNVNVIHDIDESPTVQNPVVELSILKNNANNDKIVTTTCDLGELLQLEIKLTIIQPYIDHLVPWAVRTNDLLIENPTNLDQYPLTDENGCPEQSNKLALGEIAGGGNTGFVRVPGQSDTSQTIYRTSYFECKRFTNTDQMVFKTTIDLCYGVFGEEIACINSCQAFQATNPINRRRRQVVEENKKGERDLSITLTVIGNPDTDSDKQTDSVITKEVMIVLAVVVVAFVLVLLVLAVCGYMRISKRQKCERSGSDVDSRASSDRKLPVKF